MTDLNTLTKSALNDLLPTPLTASALKKIAKADLVAMADRNIGDNDSATLLKQDFAAARADMPDDTPPATTALEQRILVAHLTAGIDCNGCETLDAMLGDNMTWSDVKETAKLTGLTQKQVQGVVASLATKGLLAVDCEPVSGEGSVQQVLTDDGLRVAFDLLVKGIEAKAPRKARTLDDRVILAPGKLDEVRPTKAGSKRALLVEALAGGATTEELMDRLGWNRDTVSAAFRTDIKAIGLGVERIDRRYHLLLPKGMKRPPLRDAGKSRTDALAAACE